MTDIWHQFIDPRLFAKYDVYNFHHAVEILNQAYPNEFAEISNALLQFELSMADLTASGGNESPIPKKLSALLKPLGWQEAKITADLHVKVFYGKSTQPGDENLIPNFVSGHHIDYVKNRVAIDMEWNSKDQTFDRDLNAFQAFYEKKMIACGVIITRSEKLDLVFNQLGIKKKYGASTTWMGKLLPRIHSGRHGGCPLLVIGITPPAITDLEARNGLVEI